MSTRSLTFIHESHKSSPVIVCIYQQMDGYFEGVGKHLESILKDTKIVNGFGSDTPLKASNGMGCLAASLIKELKEGIGGVYIFRPDSHDCDEEYIYNIYEVNGKLKLHGFDVNSKRNMMFDLGEINSDNDPMSDDEPDYNKVAEFVYPRSSDGEDTWRKIGVTENEPTYIVGHDLNDGNKIKRFNKDKILQRKIIYSDKQNNY